MMPAKDRVLADAIKEMHGFNPLDDETIEVYDIDEIARLCAADSRRWFPGLYGTKASTLTHMTLGLAGEAGEVANLVKKANRAGRLDELSVLEADAIAEELADVLMYALLAMNALGRRPASWINHKRIYNEDRFGDNDPEAGGE